VRPRGSGSVVIFPSASLKGPKIREVGIPGALDTAAIVLSVPVDIDLETGLGGFGRSFNTLFEEEWDRRCGKARWGFGLCCVQPGT